jgi:nucleotidyltransferase substrate binding protein (TIGR01987 family)
MKNFRWEQRFENFEKAYTLLKEALSSKPTKDFSALEQEGLVQRFEYTFELGWKTLKDYLLYSGVTLEVVTPREVIKSAYVANLIHHGEIWIEMLDRRNLLSHTYDHKIFAAAVEEVENNYIKLFDELYLFLKAKMASS